MNQNQTTAIVPASYFGQFETPKRPLGSGPLLQWFNGLQAGREIAVGWHIEASKCSEEVAAALAACGYKRRSVLHRSTGEIVEYYALEACSLYVLCTGFEDTWTMRENEERFGIAAGWIAGKNTSKVKSRVLIAELCAVGCYEIFTTSMQGFLTEEFLTALSEQYRVLDAFKTLAGADAPFYGFAIEIAPAQAPKMVGNGSKKSPIIPCVAVVPSEIDEAYISGHVATPDVLQVIADQDLIRKTVAWSIETSRRINRGEDRESWETPEYDAVLSHDPEPEPSPRRPAARSAESQAQDAQPALKQQLESIRKLRENLNLSPIGFVAPATFGAAKEIIAELSHQYRELRAKARQ